MRSPDPASQNTNSAGQNANMVSQSTDLASPNPNATSQSSNMASTNFHPVAGVRYRQDGMTPMAEHHAITMGESWIDATILRMHKSNHTPKEIAAELKTKSNGAIDYDSKTIGSRTTRIKKLLETQAEQRIGDDLDDWHEGEDEDLLAAEAEVDAEIHKDIQRVKSKRWELVARHLQKKINKDIPYSAGSCKKRFVALQSDTAIIPIELVDNKEQRLIERTQQSLRLLQQLQDAEFAQEQAKNKKKLEKDARELALKKKQEERSLNRFEKSRLIAQKAAAKAEKAAKEHEEREKRHLEDAARIAELQQNLLSGISNRPDQSNPAKKRKANELSSTPPTHQAQSSMLPRGKMTVTQLANLCAQRNLPKTGTKVQLQQRLETEAKGATRNELRNRLQRYNADVDGTKDELIERLALADETNADWTQDTGGSKRPRKRARLSLLSKPFIENETSSDDEDQSLEAATRRWERRRALKAREDL